MNKLAEIGWVRGYYVRIGQGGLMGGLVEKLSEEVERSAELGRQCTELCIRRQVRYTYTLDVW